MSVIWNDDIVGNSSNNKLTNKYKSGYTYMAGLNGNDTYIVNHIGSTWTEVDDLRLFDDGGWGDDGDFYYNTRGGKDSLIINNISGNNILFLFDVSKDGIYDETDDGLYIVRKDMVNSVISQAKNWHFYSQLPQKGGIDIEYFFGDKNNGGSNWGSNHIETIKTKTSGGVTYTFGLNSYINTVTSKVKTFLNNTSYNSGYEILYYGNSLIQSKLLDIYKNTPMNYTIAGTNKSNKINGGSGNDKINANGGNDTIKAGSGNDNITGGKGNDRIYFQRGNNTAIFANGHGKDVVYKGSGSDTLKFTGIANAAKLKTTLKVKKSSNDLIINYTKKDSVTLKNYYKTGTSVKKLMARNGKIITFAEYIENAIFNTYNGKRNKTNKITGSLLNDLINGNNKNDTLNGRDGNDKIYGKEGQDSIKGGNGNDYIDGGRGNDYIDGGKGNNTIYGGLGNDSIFSGAGNDYIDAGSGDDKISVSSGKNTLNGGNGQDLIKVNGGNNTINGGSGNDTIAAFGTKNVITDTSGNDHYYANIGNYTSIDDRSGSNDIISIRNNRVTAGAEHTGLHIVFNILQGSENIEKDSMMILNDNNYEKWQNNILDSSIKGINIKGSNISAIETINAGDQYKITKTQLNELQSAVASWLTTNSKRSIAEVMNGSDEYAKTDLIAVLNNNTNWQLK